MPVARESVRVMGPDSIMSSALPAGGPSKMSVNTTSASSRSTMRCAVVDPTNPPPTTVTFFLLMPLLVSNKLFLRKPSAFGDSFYLPGHSDPLHILNDRRGKRRRAHLGRARHLSLEIVSNTFLLNRPRDAIIDHHGRFLPPQELKHHRAGKHHRTRIDHVLVRILRRGAMSRFKHPVAIADIRTRRHTEPAHLSCASIGQIISVQIGSRQHAVFIRPQQDLLKHGVCDAVIDHQLVLPLSFAMRRGYRVERLLYFAVNSLLERVRSLFESRFDQRRILFHGKRGILVQIVHDPALALGDRLRSELFARQVIAPVAERALGKLLDVALVHQRNALLVVRQRVLDGPAHQPFRPRWRNRLDAHAGVPANLLLAILQHFVVQKFEELLRFRRTGFPLDPDIHILGILAKDEYIHFFRLAHRRRYTLKITDWPLTGVKIQKLPQGHVQRTYAASHWRSKRPFDGHSKITNSVDRIVRQPFVERLERFLAGENLEPRHAPLPAVRVLHRRVENAPRCFPDVTSRSIPFDEGNDRRGRNLQLAATVTDRLAVGGNSLPVIRILHEYGSLE